MVRCAAVALGETPARGLCRGSRATPLRAVSDTARRSRNRAVCSARGHVRKSDATRQMASAHVFSADVSEYLRVNGMDDAMLAQCSAALPTPSATCLRVNVPRATVESVAASLRELCADELGYTPTLYQHPALPECIILPSRGQDAGAIGAAASAATAAAARDLPRVLVGRLCGEAVLQGAHVFAPGVAAAPFDVRPGMSVAVFSDTTDAVHRGGTTAWPAAKSRKDSDLQVEVPVSSTSEWDACARMSVNAYVCLHVNSMRVYVCRSSPLLACLWDGA